MLDNEFPPKGGGMGTVNKAILERFAGFPDFDVDLVTSALDNRYSERRFDRRIQIYHVPVGRGNIHHASNLELVLYALRAWRLALRLVRSKHYDFCFAWSAVPAGAVALALERSYSLPFMTWVSGPDIPGFEQRYSYLFPILKPLLRVIWRRSRPLIAKCEEERDLIHRVEPNVPVEIVLNGVDRKKFVPGGTDVDTGPLRVVCSARLIERKGQRHLIEAARRLKDRGIDVHISFLGDGDARRAYEDLAARLEVADRIKFHGFVDPDEIPGFLQQAHVFSLPSFYEGMSLATLEAMASGLPLVTTRTGGSRDLIQEGINGFTFAWADVPSLSDHLGVLANDRGLVRSFGDASLNLSRRYGWDVIAGKFVGLIEKYQNG